MLGFAIIDHRSCANVVAVWLTSRITATAVYHTNAVTIDLNADPNVLKKVHALTRDRLVVMTDGSTTDRLPINTDTMTVKDINSVVTETTDRQTRIVKAINNYAEETGNHSLVRPIFSDPVSFEALADPESSATKRALHTANYVARVWNRWLKTDAERQSRTQHPQTKATPWIMPDELNNRVIEELPAGLTERYRPQPLKAYGA